MIFDSHSSNMWYGHSVSSHQLWVSLVELQYVFKRNVKIHIIDSRSVDTLFRLKDQGHGWGHSSKSQCESNIISTHTPFVPCQSALPLLNCDFSKFDLANQGSRSWARSQFKVTMWVGLTPYRLKSVLFHVNRASHSWVMTFSKFDLEEQMSRSWVRSQFKVTTWV